MTITVDILKRTAKMRGVSFLDMDRSAYSNTFQSETYPRFVVIKEGGPRVGKKQRHLTTYIVDSVVCPTLDDVVRALNAAPHPERAGMAQHQEDLK
jgi:hypothetical protein